MINICIYITITAFSLLIWICLASFSGYLVSVILESLLFSTQTLKNCDQIWLYHLSCARRVRLIQYCIIRHFLTSVVIFPTVLWTLSNLSLVWFFFSSCRRRGQANYSRITCTYEKLVAETSSLFSYSRFWQIFSKTVVSFTHGHSDDYQHDTFVVSVFLTSTPTYIPTFKMFIFGFFNILLAVTLSSYPTWFVSFLCPLNDFPVLRTLYHLQSLSANIFYFPLYYILPLSSKISIGIHFWSLMETGYWPSWTCCDAVPMLFGSSINKILNYRNPSLLQNTSKSTGPRWKFSIYLLRPVARCVFPHLVTCLIS